MTACCCSLAGTAACRTCSCNPNAETPPPVRSYTTIATNGVLATWKTNADRIRTMSDKELAEFLLNRDLDAIEKASKAVGFTYKVDREQCIVDVIDWLKQEVDKDEN